VGDENLAVQLVEGASARKALVHAAIALGIVVVGVCVWLFFGMWLLIAWLAPGAA
jgi:hypothetical protein